MKLCTALLLLVLSAHLIVATTSLKPFKNTKTKGKDCECECWDKKEKLCFCPCPG